ncbi:tetratricopeptide repeat protein [Haemophilus haemolyticus]|jgi:hypothetical protein|uniref:tetratricopeptide repeat protein n=1 Tax=Haemophilus haemolyticus TaxID=726 RepID=UPI003D80752C
MFKKLFQAIFTSQPDEVKVIYNQGVMALSGGYVHRAIFFFKQVCEQHPSAAYNLGLIYLDGAGKITPQYSLSRKYFQLADRLGHRKAKVSAQVIGLNEEKELSMREQLKFFSLAAKQYIEGHQLGNLSYLIAYDVIHNVLETSSNEWHSLERFISYEVYCIRNYGNREVMDLYESSSLKQWEITDEDDWNNGEAAVISDYLNTFVFPNIINQSKGKLRLDKMGTLRLAAVNAVYEYYYAYAMAQGFE